MPSESPLWSDMRRFTTLWMVVPQKVRAVAMVPVHRSARRSYRLGCLYPSYQPPIGDRWLQSEGARPSRVISPGTTKLRGQWRPSRLQSSLPLLPKTSGVACAQEWHQGPVPWRDSASGGLQRGFSGRSAPRRRLWWCRAALLAGRGNSHGAGLGTSQRREQRLPQARALCCLAAPGLVAAAERSDGRRGGESILGPPF